MITKHQKRAISRVFAALLCFLLLASHGIVTHATSGPIHESENSEQEMPGEDEQGPEIVEPPKNVTEVQYGNHYGVYFRDYEVYTDLYIMSDVSSHVYTIGSGKDVTIQCSGKLKHFLSVWVDGVMVDAGNYYLDEGSTILTFVAKYLDTLSVGKHSVTMNYTYDSIDTELTILARAEDTADVIQDVQENVTNTVSEVYDSGNPAAPKTGDKTPVVFWALVMAAALGSCVVLRARKSTV